uniref:Integrin alpha-2 domain-containing protein n=1 Tax=Branchiostoma floridae TaxID=7739 RepID=C3Y3Z0_BRAFL|eukprot:XP_002609006.1 hypothetical protein BRAFLDRAFT_84822 [Branchiostoma floridae]
MQIFLASSDFLLEQSKEEEVRYRTAGRPMLCRPTFLPKTTLTLSHLTSDKRPLDRQGCEHTSQLFCGAKLENRLTATFWNIQVKLKDFLPCANIYSLPVPYRLLVGAPRANWTHAPDLERPGALYRCPLDSHNCSQVVVDTEGSRSGTKRMVEIKYRDNKNNMWLGATVRTHQDRVVVCGPMWKNAYFRRYTILNGICYEMDASLKTDTVQKRMPCLGDQPTTVTHPLGHQINEGGDYTYGKCQTGLAALYTQNGSKLVLGAPGGYDWTGTLSTYTGSYQTTGHPETWDPWPEGGAVKQPHDSYIGFSLAAGKFFGDGVEYIAAGAPRHQHRGAVVFFQETTGNDGALQPTNTLKGTQLASGFGYSMVALDLTNDGVTDLLVGAPVYLEKGVGGAVYLYSTRDKATLQLVTMLTGPPASHFGLSLSSAGDLNGDGFTDIAVGAPNEGSGAVYIYHGTKSGLKENYAQVGLLPLFSSQPHPLSLGAISDDNITY